ncbi:MAG: phosphate/phosphite/phosphonate ABC transporter substrate-binding protein [Trueperaceae bacterium]|nr:phosphate/phosphite/phosphonate ABC transporter substrate-binding protein [Trueperaceae bacterium]
MKNRLRTLLLAIAALATLGFGTAQADCPRGTLADRFCDVDGDLLADVPTDPADFVDPDTLIFAYTPVEDPAVYRDVWAGFIEHMEAVTGKSVQFFAVDSNAAQLEAMRAGRLHVAGFNTGSVPFAVNTAGFRPFAMMAAADGSFGYEMEIIVPADSDIESPADLAGRAVAFTAPTSNSGFKAPSALLESEFGLVAERDFTTSFSGGHDASILGVANKDYEAAAIANSVKTRMIEREVFDPADVRVIYSSQTFPTTAYGTVFDLDPELAAKVQEAFSSFEWAGSALEAEFSQSGEAQFIPITYLEYWAVIRQIDEANGVVYE